MRQGRAGRSGVGSDRSARRQQRAQDFGARHPRLTSVIVGVLLAGVTAICGFQLRHGGYLGHSWAIAALAGMVAAAGISAATLISSRRHSAAAFPLMMVWLVLGVVSASSIRFPFPVGPYGSAQAFFNVVHALLLGYEATIGTALVALLGYVIVRPRTRAGGGTGQPGRARVPAGLPASLRFLGATTATWRAGRLIAANGTVKWLSLKEDAEADLTSGCHALPLQAATERRQPRTTTLATTDGLVEVDVSPRALIGLADSLRRAHNNDMADPLTED